MDKTIRWKQRFANFSKAFHQLEKTVQISKPSEAERGGLVQFFKLSFELAWKTMKDFLEAEGFLVKSPRETLKQAFQIQMIVDGQAWLEALEDRNLTTHIYDEATAQKIENNIRQKYFPILQSFFTSFEAKL